MTTASHQFFSELAYIGFVVSFAEGTFPNSRFWLGDRVGAHDSQMSFLSTFGTDSDSSVWDVGTIVEWRWHVFVGLLHMV